MHEYDFVIPWLVLVVCIVGAAILVVKMIAHRRLWRSRAHCRNFGIRRAA